jgi:hypothetical protein
MKKLALIGLLSIVAMGLFVHCGTSRSGGLDGRKYRAGL